MRGIRKALQSSTTVGCKVITLFLMSVRSLNSSVLRWPDRDAVHQAAGLGAGASYPAPQAPQAWVFRLLCTRRLGCGQRPRSRSLAPHHNPWAQGRAVVIQSGVCDRREHGASDYLNDDRPLNPRLCRH